VFVCGFMFFVDLFWIVCDFIIIIIIFFLGGVCCLCVLVFVLYVCVLLGFVIVVDVC